MIYYFVPYTHFSLPPIIDRRPDFREITWELSLHKSLLKWFNKPEWDHDWRKACGIKADYLRPLDFAIMAGFRPTQDRKFELTAYQNVNGEKMFPPTLLTLNMNGDWSEKCVINLKRESDIWNYTFNEVSYKIELPTESVNFFQINPYYGGQATSRFGMKLKLKWR